MLSALPEDERDDTRPPIDSAEVDRAIADGVAAIDWLFKHAADDWSRWTVVVRGWKALRTLAIDRARTSDTMSQDYRNAMSGLLNTAKHSRWKQIRPGTRAAMTSIMDHIDEIDKWYEGLDVDKKLHWKNPQTIAKWVAEEHPEYVVRPDGAKPRKPKRKAKGKKKKGNPEAERLRKMILELLDEYVEPVAPARARALRAELYRDDPDDTLDGAIDGDETDEPPLDDVA